MPERLYPVLPCLGPPTVIIINTFDLQGGSREEFAPQDSGRLRLIVIVDRLFIRLSPPEGAARAPNKRRKTVRHGNCNKIEEKWNDNRVFKYPVGIISDHIKHSLPKTNMRYDPS